MRLNFLVPVFVCISLFSLNILSSSLPSCLKVGIKSALNQKAVREIKIKNLITTDKKNYPHPFLGSLIPKKFQILINNQEIRDESTHSIILDDNKLVINRFYLFGYWPLTYQGNRTFTYEIAPEHTEVTLDYDWITSKEIEAVDEKTSLVVKTKSQIILNPAKYLHGSLAEDGSQHAPQKTV